MCFVSQMKCYFRSYKQHTNTCHHTEWIHTEGSFSSHYRNFRFDFSRKPLFLVHFLFRNERILLCLVDTSCPHLYFDTQSRSKVANWRARHFIQMRLKEAGLWKADLKRIGPGYESRRFCENGNELSGYVKVWEFLSCGITTNCLNKILPRRSNEARLRRNNSVLM
jgi:hypothetical protein